MPSTLLRYKPILSLSGIFLFLAAWSANAQWVKLTQYNGKFYNEVYFYDQNLGIITGHDGSMLRTSNGGTTWSSVTLPGAGSSANRDICFVSTSIGFVSGEDGIWKSTDGGLSWANVTPSGVTSAGSSSCWFRNASVGVWGYGPSCFDSVTTFWRTTDGGSTWTGTSDTANAIDATVGGMTYAGGSFYAAGGSGKLWKSTDDGITWTLSPTNSGGWQEDLISSTAGLFIASADGTTCGTNGSGKILRSMNGGTSWTATSFAGTIMWGVSMYSTPSGSEGWAVGDYAKAYKTTDGGATWNESSCGLKAGDRLDDVFMISATHGFAVGDGIYRFASHEFTSDPDTIDFGDVIIGTSRGDSLALITAIGNSGLVTNRVFAGANIGDFSSPDALTVSQPVPSCASAATRIRFYPLTLGVKTARIEFTVQGVTNPLVVHLRGKGVRPRIIGERTHRFDTLICETEILDTITITNNGDYPLEIDSIVPANNIGIFSVEEPMTPVTIPPMQFRKFVIRARAFSSGNLGGRFYFYTNDPDFQDSAWTIDVSLYKHDLDLSLPADTTITIPPAPLGVQSSVRLNVRNDGTLRQTIQQVSGEGTDGTIRTGFASPVPIAVDDSGSIEFTARASDTISRCRRFRIVAEPCGRERFVTVCYQATEASLSLPSTLSMVLPCGEGENTLAMKNLGNADLRVDSIRIEGVDRNLFSYTASANFPLTILPAESKSLTIRFSGGIERGDRTAFMVVFLGDGKTDTVRLEVQVTGPELVPSPGVIDLGSLCPGDTILSGLLLENIGEKDAVFASIDISVTDQQLDLMPTPPTIPAGTADSIRFRLVTEKPGPFEGALHLHYQPCDRLDTIRIIGKVLSPALELEAPEINLGQIPINRERIGETGVWNRSSEEVNILLSRIGHPDLTLKNPVGSGAITGTDSIRITVAVTPTQRGPGVDTIEVLGTGTCTQLLKLPIRWNGIAGGPYLSDDIDFGDVPCDEVPVAFFRLYNGGDELLTLEEVLPSSDERIRVEPGEAIPASILPFDSIEVKVHMIDPASGDLAESVRLVVRSTSGKLDTLTANVTGRRLLPQSRFVDDATGQTIVTFRLPTFYSCRSGLDTTVTVRNEGNIADTLDIVSLDPALQVLASPLPVVLEPGTSATVPIRVQVSEEGEYRLGLRAFSRVCPDSIEVEIQGRAFDEELELPDTVDFGTICLDDSIRQSIVFLNNLPDQLLIESVTLVGGNNWSVRPPARNVYEPGEEDSIVVNLTALSASLATAELRVRLSEPCPREFIVHLRGEIVDCPKPDIVLRGGSAIGRWGETVQVPVVADASTLESLEEFSFSVTAARTMLHPENVRLTRRAEELFELTGSAYNADSGILHLSLRSVTTPGEINLFSDTLLVIDYQVLRGDGIAAAIDLEPVELAPDGTLGAVDGEFLLADYCDAHGRLLRITGDLALRPITPNPAADVALIEYEVPFTGPVSLVLYDQLGREVMTLLDEVVPAGSRRTQLNLEGLSSGQYLVGLEIGLQRLTERFIVRK